MQKRLQAGKRTTSALEQTETQFMMFLNTQVKDGATYPPYRKKYKG